MSENSLTICYTFIINCTSLQKILGYLLIRARDCDACINYLLSNEAISIAVRDFLNLIIFLRVKVVF